MVALSKNRTGLTYGHLDWNNNLKELNGSKRVWIIISHMSSNKIKGRHQEAMLLEYLSKSGGRLLDKFSSRSVGEGGAYLFDLSKFPGQEL